MPYLNWSQAPIQLASNPHPERETELSLELSASAAHELGARLNEVLGEGASLDENTRAAELRVDLPRGWTLFWKLHVEDSRLYVAHPDKDVWVATFALTRQHARSLLGALEAMGEQGGAERVALSELVPSVNRFSNLELVIKKL